MTVETIYCVQPYWRTGDRFAEGSTRHYDREEAARRAGERAARQVGGAIVYSVEGDPAFESWSRPQLLAKHGAVPDVRF